MKALVNLAVSLCVVVMLGAIGGMILSSPRQFTDPERGTVPAHRCVSEIDYLCGLFVEPGGEVIEVSNRLLSARNRFVTRPQNGGWTAEPTPVLRDGLTARQVEKALASRADLRRKATEKGAETGAAVGFAVWSGLAGLLTLYVLFRLARDHGPGANRAARGLAQTLGGRVGTAGRTFAENAALRSEVRRSELLARKAVADATRARQDPDVSRHKVELSARTEG